MSIIPCGINGVNVPRAHGLTKNGHKPQPQNKIVGRIQHFYFSLSQIANGKNVMWKWVILYRKKNEGKYGKCN